MNLKTTTTTRTGKLKVPAWNDLVKGGAFKELAPTDIDWFYVRCASVARHLYVRRAGVGAFQKVYGGHKRNGVKPGHFCRASANVIRKCLQALESVKLVEKREKYEKFENLLIFTLNIF